MAEESKHAQQKEETWIKCQQHKQGSKIEVTTVSGWLVKGLQVDPGIKRGVKRPGQTSYQKSSSFSK